MAKVSITRTDPDLYPALIRAIDSIGEKPVAPGDRVLIKPNLVEPADPESGKITTTGLIEAVGRYCLDCGAAKVIIGKGPSYYQPQSYLRECFTRTGVSEVANRLGIEWVLFDEHGYRTFQGVSSCTPEEFRISRFALSCDKFINLPVLKTHYLTAVTLAMKNLKGCLKREDKPLFHRWDLGRAIVELCKIVSPTVNIIDCTAKTLVRQLGTGHSNEKQDGESLLVASSDIVAVNAVGCALMGIDPAEVRTVSLGAAAGLGGGDLTQIDIVGNELKQLKFKVKLPRQELQQSFPLLEIIGAEKACSGYLIPLLSSLMLLRERGMKTEKPLAILLGTAQRLPEDKACLLVGDCAQSGGKGEEDWVCGCPPDREELLSALTRVITR